MLPDRRVGHRSLPLGRAEPRAARPDPAELLLGVRQPPLGAPGEPFYECLELAFALGIQKFSAC